MNINDINMFSLVINEDQTKLIISGYEMDENTRYIYKRNSIR